MYEFLIHAHIGKIEYISNAKRNFYGDIADLLQDQK